MKNLKLVKSFFDKGESVMMHKNMLVSLVLLSFGFEKMCGMKQANQPNSFLSNDDEFDSFYNERKKARSSKNNDIMDEFLSKDDEIVEQYTPISDFFVTRVERLGMSIAQALVSVGVTHATIDDIAKVRDVSALSEQKAAYLLGYVQQCVWNLLDNKGMSGNEKQLERIVEVVKNLQMKSKPRRR